MPARQYPHPPQIKKEEDDCGYLAFAESLSNAHTLTELKQEVKTEHSSETSLLSVHDADSKEDMRNREDEEMVDKKEVVRDERFFMDNLGPSIRNALTAAGARYCRHAFATDNPDDYKFLQFWQGDDHRPYHYKHSDGSIFFRNPDQSTYYYSPIKSTCRYISPEGEESDYYVSSIAEAERGRAMYCFPCNILDEV